MAIFKKLRLSSNLKRAYSGAASEEAIPFLRGLPVVGRSLTIAKAGGAPKFHQYVEARHGELGPIYRECLGQLTATFVSEPALMRAVFTAEGAHPKHFLPEAWLLYNQRFNCKRGLFFMEGEEWLKYRRIMNKLLLKEKISPQLKTVYESVVDNLVNRWKQQSGGIINNLEHELYRHSISFVMATVMGSTYVEKHGLFEEDLDELTNSFMSIFETTSKLLQIPPKLAAFLRLSVWKEFVRSTDSSLSASQDVVARMRDLCSSDGLLRKLLDEGVPFEMTQALIVDLMLAAGDTTAYTTQWALYEISKKEADFTPGDVGGVVREALRLYPSAPFIVRRLGKPLHYKHHLFSSGEWMILSLFTAGRSDSNYPNAMEFIPGRWRRSSEGAPYQGVTQPLAFMPFALGARACVGRNLANLQMNLTVQKLISSFKFELQEEVDVILKMVPVPEKPIKIKLYAKSR